VGCAVVQWAFLISVDVSAAGVFLFSVDVLLWAFPFLTGLLYISSLEFYFPWVNRSLWLIGMCCVIRLSLWACL
jgi:hypothetical protein